MEYFEIDSTQKREMTTQNMVFTLPVVQISVDQKEYYGFARSFSVSEIAKKRTKLFELSED